MPMIGWRHTLMGLWQRLQLRALRLSADLVLVTTEAWSEQLMAMRPRRRVRHLPVGSTLPDMRSGRAAARASLGVADGRLVVATLSSGHESHLVPYVETAVASIAARSPDVLLLTLGAGARQVTVAGVEVVRPGELTPDDLARLVAASDLFLVPLIDGVSTRRTSAMAALQHEVAVVATDGHLTDSMLRDAGIPLAPVGERDAFVSLAADMATDAARRTESARAGRALYERSFDWSAIAERFVAAVEQA
jgi:glycosyltransferase involved in cell wall biosynthesis